MLNISIVNIIFTVLNLLILLFVFKKFLFGRIDTILEQRRAEVDSATQEAEKAVKEAEQVKKDYETQIAKVNEEKEQVLAEIKKQGYEEYDKIINMAKQKSDMIMKEAKHNAEVEETRVKEAYAASLADIVVDAASKIAATRHSKEEDIELYDTFIREAGAKDEQDD